VADCPPISVVSAPSRQATWDGIDFSYLSSCSDVVGVFPAGQSVTAVYIYATIDSDSLFNFAGDNTSYGIRQQNDINNSSPASGYYYRCNSGIGSYISPTLIIDYNPAISMLTDAATNIISSSATLNGRNTGSQIVPCYFEWEVYDADYDVIANGNTDSQNINGAFHDHITMPSGWYVVAFRAVGEYGGETYYGGWLAFITDDINAITTLPADQIGNVGQSARLNGSGGDGYDSNYFQYGQSATSLNRTTSPRAGAASFSQFITGLNPAVTYYFRAVGIEWNPLTSTTDYAYGETLSFLSSGTPPIIASPRAGFVWVENDDLHYIDELGDERKLVMDAV
jgi:hypothetical protein